jgi:septal ring factor EnvC (AmiA/AmiB activator)
MYMRRSNFLLLLFSFCLPGLATSADDLARSIDTSSSNNREEAASQQRIDRLSEEAARMLEEYQAASRELESLQVYNDQLERLVDSQQQEKDSIRQQMTDIELTQREIVPLMLRMLERLQEIVLGGHPFLEEERSTRIKQLRDLMDRADVSAGEKFRRILEAYQIELEYGRTIESYQGELTGAATRTVDFLRIGRLAIFYLTLDGKECGMWDAAGNNWITLSTDYILPLQQGMRIARKQAAPDLLRLPLPVASGGAS